MILKPVTILIPIFFALMIVPGVHAQDNYSLKSVKATIQGTSSLHDWESEITDLKFKGLCLVQNGILKDIKSAEIKISVISIKSTKGKVMDDKTYEAFNSGKFPLIVFKLKNEKINTETFTVDLTGTLEMAGTTNPVELVANYKVMPNGFLQITGNKKIKMTEFKMVPPRAMLGTIKVGDEVTINFDIILSNTNTVL